MGRGDEGANWRELTEEAKSKLAAAASAEHEVLQRVGRKRALITAVSIGVTVFNGLVGSLSNDVGILGAGGEEGSHAELPAIPLFSEVPPSSDHAMADEGGPVALPLARLQTSGLAVRTAASCACLWSA